MSRSINTIALRTRSGRLIPPGVFHGKFVTRSIDVFALTLYKRKRRDPATITCGKGKPNSTTTTSNFQPVVTCSLFSAGSHLLDYTVEFHRLRRDLQFHRRISVEIRILGLVLVV